jgi:hypothetical protein
VAELLRVEQANLEDAFVELTGKRLGDVSGSDPK